MTKLPVESCPFCNGTGLRVVAPPPGKRGGWNRRGKGRRHGYESTYQAGCRCEWCRAAHRTGAARRKAAKEAI